MITYAQAERLLDIHAADRSVLSLYVGIPRDPAQLRELPARAHDLIRLAAADLDGYRGQAAGLAEDERRVSRLLEVHGREWLGHTAALFAAAGTGQAEAFALPCQLPDRAILATRPHIRPLLVTLQRCPAHYVVTRLAVEHGIRQFLDIGSGLPTADNTHEVARRAAPGARRGGSRGAAVP